jgi:mannan polymerase II complex MNN10 subunit
MLLRSLKVPPSLLLLVAFLVFFGWQLSQGPRHEDGPLGSQPIPGEKKAPRIALMTFVTEQRSYLHLSLKNKARKLPTASSRYNPVLMAHRLCASPRIRPCS